MLYFVTNFNERISGYMSFDDAVAALEMYQVEMEDTDLDLDIGSIEDC